MTVLSMGMCCPAPFLPHYQRPPLRVVILIRLSLVQTAQEPHKHLKEAVKVTVRPENLILKAFMSPLSQKRAD